MIATAAYISAGCRLYVLVVLCASVVGKVATISGFQETVAGLFGLPDRAARRTALAVVGAEALIAAALVAGPDRARVGMAAAMALFSVFWFVIFVALIRERAIICNCFGGHGRRISRLDLLRNGALIATCGFFLSQPIGNILDPAAWLLLLGLALIAFLISTNLDEIALLSRRSSVAE